MRFAIWMIRVYMSSIPRVILVTPSYVGIAVSEFPDVSANANNAYIRRIPIFDMTDVLFCRLFHGWLQVQRDVIFVIISRKFCAAMIALIPVLIYGRDVYNPMLFPMATRILRRCRSRIITSRINPCVLIPGVIIVTEMLTALLADPVVFVVKLMCIQSVLTVE